MMQEVIRWYSKIAILAIDDDLTILLDEVEAVVKSPRNGKSNAAHNITAEEIKAGGEHIIDALTAICNKLWSTKQWTNCECHCWWSPSPNKGDLQLCQNYRTISLTSHVSKVMFKSAALLTTAASQSHSCRRTGKLESRPKHYLTNL